MNREQIHISSEEASNTQSHTWRRSKPISSNIVRRHIVQEPPKQMAPHQPRRAIFSMIDPLADPVDR